MIWTSRPVLWPGRDEQVTASLATAASSLISFCRVIQPVIAAVQTDAELSRRFRDRLAAQGRGPQRGTEVIAEYLTAEQALGRVSPSADPQAAAVLLTGACHQIAFVDQLLGPGHAVSHPDAASLVNTLLAGLVPHPPRLGKDHPMVNIHLVRDTQLPPERIIGALTDFSGRRLELFPTLARQYFTVHETGDTHAEATEGSSFAGGIWERARYDWSEPGTVTLTVVESNAFAPGST